MAFVVALVLIAVLHIGVEFTPRRHRVLAAGLTITALGVTFLWAGWEGGPRTAPGYTGIILILFGAALTLISFRRAAPEEPVPDADETLLFPARLITGLWAWG